MSTKFCIFVFYSKRHLCKKFEPNGTRNKEVAKIANDIIVKSFLEIAEQYFVCQYFLLIPIDVPSVKLIEGQIKELQGVVRNTPPPPPWADNDQKSQCRIGLKSCSSYNSDSISKLFYLYSL